MTKTTNVDAFIASWDLPKKAEVETLRAIILGADPSIKEEIKWNAPSFFVSDHSATVRPRPLESVQVVFHTGAKVKDVPRAIKINNPDNLLKWVTEDRCVVTFDDMADIQAKKASFESVVHQWIAQL
jgi:hypothetical protein